MMLMLKLLILGPLALYLPLVAAAESLTAQCNPSELSPDASAATAQTYLKQHRQNLTSACIENAIAIIREKMYAAAIPALIKYLDFEIDPKPVVCYDPMTNGPTCGLYPAVDALARFQDSAVPALKGAVQDEDLSKVGRLNAAPALFHVVKNRPEQIRFTIKTARSSRYPDIAEALTKLARKWAHYCIPAERQQCSDALNTR
jgi:hypothetical protein